MATLSDLRTVARDSSMYDKVDDKSTRVIDRAVNTSLRLIAQARDWEFFNSVGRVNTVANQSSGTIAITAGAATATLASGTWPTDLTDYSIRIASSTVDYQFGTRSGDNTGIFVSGQVWLGDTQTSASYTLYRSRYDLPGDCRKFGGVVTQNLDWAPQYIDREAFEYYKAGDITSTGDAYWISHDNTYLYLWPGTQEKLALMFDYQRWPASASTAGDTIDWDGTRIDLLYATLQTVLNAHKNKMTWAEVVAESKMLCKRWGDTEPKRNAHNSVRPMFPFDSIRPFGHRLEWDGN